MGCVPTPANLPSTGKKTFVSLKRVILRTTKTKVTKTTKMKRNNTAYEMGRSGRGEVPSPIVRSIILIDFHSFYINLFLLISCPDPTFDPHSIPQTSKTHGKSTFISTAHAFTGDRDRIHPDVRTGDTTKRRKKEKKKDKRTVHILCFWTILSAQLEHTEMLHSFGNSSVLALSLSLLLSVCLSICSALICFSLIPMSILSPQAALSTVL